ncbi:MAG: gliding motility-associated ABC transporter substrate-binding protein GldG [Paludibacteraceae bacterium]|nr:gliding motility-associated ABC transporter substrate-binding protein GldG [Paludibacteraceae bacterium]
MKQKNTYILGAIAALLVVYLFSEKLFFRWDLTSEKRYSISENTKSLLKDLKGEYTIKLYLDGDLSAGFLQLRKSAKEMAEEFSAYTDADIKVVFENPTQGANEEERDKHYGELERRGLTVMREEEDKDEYGQTITRIVCPWAEISNGKRKKLVSLYQDNRDRSIDENLNNASANLEYALTDAIRQLTKTNIDRILFTEGHGELPEILTYDVCENLRNYYQIDRGDLRACYCPDSLFAYKAIIVAGPTQPFSEKDKYLIDQYVMHGGKVMWLIDGVHISLDSLRTASETIGVGNNLNLEDQLFRYGVRIEPVLVQDEQCSKLPVNTAPENEAPKWKPKPWYYAPLLLTSPVHPISKNITPVKSEFASLIKAVGDDKDIRRDILLVTSTSSRIQQMPSIVSMSIVNIDPREGYFNVGNAPIAVAMKGHFASNFSHRLKPEGIYSKTPQSNRSYETKMIVIADADIICNDVIPGSDGQPKIVPLGMDRYEGRQYGNKEFIMNCINYLTDDEGWMQLRSRELQLRLLNKQASTIRKFWQIANVVLPLVVLALLGGGYYLARKRKYTK